VGIWQDFLGIGQIGIRDSFFALGGDSLLAARVYAQVRRDFGVDLPVARMFELMTVRRISLFIAISRDPTAIDRLSEEEVDDCLEAMES
jgi:acyl carrier protein